MRIALCAGAALVLAACAQKSEEATSEAPAAEAVAAAPGADAAASAPGPTGAPRVAAGPPMLAYTYSYGLSLPPRRVREVMARHESACARAGHQLCQVVSSSVRNDDDDAASAELVLRAAPAWLKSFRDGLAGEARAAGGRLVRSETESEDLSREIVDTEAQLRAKATLRDRLQGLLVSRPGKLSDLLEVERELARVQAEIDSTQSQLAVMRARVAMSEVTITYASPGTLIVNNDGGSQLARAFRDFGDIVAQSVAGMVYFLAWVLPWAVLLAGLVWLLGRRLRRIPWPLRRKPKAGTGTPT